MQTAGQPRPHREGQDVGGARKQVALIAPGMIVAARLPDPALVRSALNERVRRSRFQPADHTRHRVSAKPEQPMHAVGHDGPGERFRASFRIGSTQPARDILRIAVMMEQRELMGGDSGDDVAGI